MAKEEQHKLPAGLFYKGNILNFCNHHLYGEDSLCYCSGWYPSNMYFMKQALEKSIDDLNSYKKFLENKYRK